MAWAEKLPSGKYRGCWRRPDGKQDHTRRATHPEHPYSRKRDALEAAQEEEVKARRQAAATKGKVSASITWGEWWDLLAPDYPDSDTGSVVASIVRTHVRPRWGEEPLNKIHQVDVKAWVADLLPGRKPAYVQKIYGVFRLSINQAVEKRVLGTSPCVGIKVPKAPKRAKPYTDTEYLAAISPHLPAGHRDLLQLGLETGLRPSELGGLHADMVDLDSGWLYVSKVLVEYRKTIRHYPKDLDDRRVPLSDKAIEIIRRNLADRDLTGGCGLVHASQKKPCASPLVFRNSRGGVITPNTLLKAVRYAVEKAKIEYRGRGPYSVRRGFGTRAARGGIDAFELAEIMGHADVRQTQEYVQETPAARERLRAALGESTRLTVVREQPGAESGAHSHKQTPQRTTPKRDGAVS